MKPLDIRNWSMELTGVWPLPGHRQASEGLQISDKISARDKLAKMKNSAQYSILNSKKEFRQPGAIILKPIPVKNI